MQQPPLNPYAPPSSVASSELPAPALGEYRPLGPRALAVTIALVFNIVVELLAVGNALTTLSAMKRGLAGEAVEDGVVLGMVERNALVAIAQLAVAIGAAVCFCLVVARASRNARSFGQMPMQFTTGWAVGFFFIPIVSLWKPYQAMKEIWRASSPSTEDAHSLAHAEVSPLLPAWWAAFLVHALAGQVVSRMSGDDVQPVNQVTNTAYVTIVSAAATIVAAALAIAVVRALAARQDACQKAAEAWRAAQQAPAIR